MMAFHVAICNRKVKQMNHMVTELHSEVTEELEGKEAQGTKVARLHYEAAMLSYGVVEVEKAGSARVN